MLVFFRNRETRPALKQLNLALDIPQTTLEMMTDRVVAAGASLYVRVRVCDVSV